MKSKNMVIPLEGYLFMKDIARTEEGEGKKGWWSKKKSKSRKAEGVPRDNTASKVKKIDKKKDNKNHAARTRRSEKRHTGPIRYYPTKWEK